MAIKITADLIRKLRDESGAPVMRVKQVLEAEGDEAKALAILRKEGFEKVAKREGRETTAGMVFSYTHHSGKVAVLVELLSETDFVARNELFSELGKNLCLQITSMAPVDVKDLLDQEFIKDPSQKVNDLVASVIAKTGENVKVSRFSRLEIGK
jgi:elongation factor Ts